MAGHRLAEFLDMPFEGVLLVSRVLVGERGVAWEARMMSKIMWSFGFEMFMHFLHVTFNH